MANLSAQQWVQKKFGIYYNGAKPTIPEIGMREFGFGGWEKKIEFRHMCFPTNEQLWMRLRKDAPLFVSCSAAYYEFPAARPMERKNWLGADLIFDLDAEADALAPFILPSSLEDVKRKTHTLIEEFLIPDFGYSKDEISINFSGSRGFHVHCYKKEAQMLGRAERREIVDYIEGAGLGFDDFLHEEQMPATRFKRIAGPSPSSGGHKGRFAKHVINILKNPSAAPAIHPKFKKEENRIKMIKGIENGRWSDVQIPHALEFFKAVFSRSRIRLSNRVETDANVTIDTGKILRLPDSIHGGSGLLALTVSKGFDSFEPLKDALAFSTTRIEAIDALIDVPSQEFAGQTFDAIKKGERAHVPECYAVYLVCKKAAVPA
ncbi:DNA primase catalytic subunit PriS [Candidatus Micrarchaeota archaeon CG10_big_fil_rev_8_21_14_0_10_45_29]|nr:MAG: DNA primase catalytic subunit PriS [Candidatus Micrarchaeota archaeon CG10_big_fil_rev_8_21_14_0_10_45_29]QBM01551.1 hypothetical protein [uncultured archaeon]